MSTIAKSESCQVKGAELDPLSVRTLGELRELIVGLPDHLELEPAVQVRIENGKVCFGDLNA